MKPLIVHRFPRFPCRIVFACRSNQICDTQLLLFNCTKPNCSNFRNVNKKEKKKYDSRSSAIEPHSSAHFNFYWNSGHLEIHFDAESNIMEMYPKPLHQIEITTFQIRISTFLLCTLGIERKLRNKQYHYHGN